MFEAISNGVKDNVVNKLLIFAGFLAVGAAYYYNKKLNLEEKKLCLEEKKLDAKTYLKVARILIEKYKAERFKNNSDENEDNLSEQKSEKIFSRTQPTGESLDYAKFTADLDITGYKALKPYSY